MIVGLVLVESTTKIFKIILIKQGTSCLFTIAIIKELDFCLNVKDPYISLLNNSYRRILVEHYSLFTLRRQRKYEQKVVDVVA